MLAQGARSSYTLRRYASGPLGRSGAVSAVAAAARRAPGHSTLNEAESGRSRSEPPTSTLYAMGSTIHALVASSQ